MSYYQLCKWELARQSVDTTNCKIHFWHYNSARIWTLLTMQVWHVNDENQSSCWLFGIKGIIWIPDTLVCFWNSKMPSYHSDTRHHGTGYGLFVHFLSSFWQWLKIWTPVFGILMLSPSQYQTINCLIFRSVDSTYRDRLPYFSDYISNFNVQI